ncbi:KH domain-containing protein [Candidatus Microgenomates bacterium]|nr:KH domain-containing protein [Candidatus Microgenomates bacterium]
MDKTDLIKSEAEDLLKKIIEHFEVEVSNDEDVYHVTIKAEEEAPVVIGRHGETIKALQKILEVILYKKAGSSVEILLNVNDYREKQQERLEEIANRYAQKAVDYRSPSYVRGLSSYERKVVHEYVTKNYPDLTSYSTGEGRDRRLVIDAKGNEPHTESTDRPESTE